MKDYRMSGQIPPGIWKRPVECPTLKADEWRHEKRQRGKVIQRQNCVDTWRFCIRQWLEHKSQRFTNQVSHVVNNGDWRRPDTQQPVLAIYRAICGAMSHTATVIAPSKFGLVDPWAYLEGGRPPQAPQKIVVLPRRRIDWRHFSCCNAKRIGYESQTTQLRSVV